MGTWLNQADLENATTPTMVAAIFGDGNGGPLNEQAIAAVIDRGEQEVLSWLQEYGPPPFSAAVMAQLAADPFLKYAALDYTIAHMFDRHPEYPQGGTSAKERDMRFQRAKERMERVLAGRQRPPTVITKPANIGGAVYDGASRIYVDSPGQPASNSGDY